MKKTPKLSQQVELAKRAAYLHTKLSGKRCSRIPNKKRAASRKHCRG